MERRNLATRPWAKRKAADSGAAPIQMLPYLWFTTSGDDDAFQVWTRDNDVRYVPCFRSREDAEALSEAAGVASSFVLGFPIFAVPDLMLDLPDPVFVVTAVSADGGVDGHYLPRPQVPVAASGSASSAA